MLNRIWAFLLAMGISMAPAFAEPAQRAPLKPLSPHFSPVPFELMNGAALFHVTIAGHDVIAMLDNRAEESAIEASFARAAELTLSTKTGFVGTVVGAARKIQVDDVPVIIPGEVEFRASLQAIDLSNFSRHVGRNISFVFGNEYLSTVELMVATGDRSFMIGPSGVNIPPADFPMIRLENARPQIKIMVGPQPLMVTLDLGSNAELSLSREAWARVAPKDTSLKTVLETTLAGAVLASRGQLAEVHVGPVNARNVSAMVTPQLRADGDGTIGFGFLSHFDFVLDVRAGKLWLAPLGSLHFKQVSAGT